MGRSVPLWLVLLLSLIFALFLIFFSWQAVTAARDRDAPKGFGAVAVKIASAPDIALGALDEISRRASGEWEDENLRVERDPGVSTEGFRPLEDPASGLRGLSVKADLPAMERGWRLLAGGFDFDGETRNAALLLSPDLKVARRWMLDEIAVDDAPIRPENRKVVHGIDLLRDGSLVVAFDGGETLQRFDACGARDWAVRGAYHHAVTLDETGDTVWTLLGEDGLAQVSVADGSVLRRIDLDDVIARNPEIDILELRRSHPVDNRFNPRSTRGQWLEDPFHLNDVEALPAALAEAYPMFAAGDLLVSARSLNLIFVLDPQSLEIKWWRAGATQRQHDPDWLPNGRIGVFNNRMSRDYSEVVEIDPQDLSRQVVWDGRENGFYTRIRGKQQRLPGGGLAVVSSQQGRAFETNAEGRVVFELLNRKPGDEAWNYVLTDLKWAPEDYLDPQAMRCPSP